MEEDCSQWTCNMCGNTGMADGSDGYFYCLRCGSQADDIIDTGVADEDFIEKGTQGGGAVYLASHTRHSRQPVISAQPISHVDPQSQQFWSNLNQDGIGDGMGPSGTSDFGSYSMCTYSYEGYYQEVRNRYVMGLQMMIEAQCEALVEKFNVKPLICGIVGPIWLRFLASTGIFDDGWADEAIHQSEIQKSGEIENFKPYYRHKAEPHNIHGQRALMIWNKYLRKKIPLSCSLAISFLGCHIAREAVLPTDLIKWSVEGELTYFDAFVEIEKRIGQSLPPFPLTLRSMFRPAHAYSAQQLESLAATIAQGIGLNLPPVNFYEIASRYLKELSISVEEILPRACRIYEWAMPPELWLSANSSGLPTRVNVMSILIVAIRILYDINGLGVWEKSLSSPNPPSRSTEAMSKDPASSPRRGDDAENSFGSPHSVDDLGTSSTKNPSSDHESKFDAAGLLHNLEARYNEIYNTYGGVKCTRDLSKSMPSYLQFCKDVVFAGSEPAVDFFHEEKTLIDKLWNYYQEEKGSQPVEGLTERNSSADIMYKANKKVRDNAYHSSPSHDGRTSHEDILTQRRSDVDNSSMTSEEHENPEPSDKVSAETNEHRALRLMKKNMEENRFCYIPPRIKLRRLDYLQYVRKRDEGAITYVAHADYYILLRACAMVAEVDMRIMHVGVLGIERRLDWMEKRIDHCLHLTPSTTTCKFCSDEPEQAADHTIELSNPNVL
ncbi:putative transcription factor [Hibiscus syriacus]|uniref:Transcription factor n=1 Tax=Hibiscus syriacus TaxID=106335 RepID=A0A6A2ZK29_HIBSY|nr:TATA box-binding protein-associated factor RNA polymerase I subunit B-like [Hibiscus syriacus]XP_039013995.1 TATA box-binding protein-associated factor RNA polymerase I subunit B-like [Hibiscus syriacus]KAE8691926.1 putative transcription factor [Hibiscus syriacus]